jgi:hypothetical protein
LHENKTRDAESRRYCQKTSEERLRREVYERAATGERRKLIGMLLDRSQCQFDIPGCGIVGAIGFGLDEGLRHVQTLHRVEHKIDRLFWLGLQNVHVAVDIGR